MLRWILQIICLRHESENAERQALLNSPTSPKFPPPHTILTAPKPRPSPLPDLPHHRHARSQSHQYGSIRNIKPEDPGPRTASEDHGVDGRRENDSPERLGGISKFYSQRMRPLTRSSLPPSPAFTPHHPTTAPQTAIPPQSKLEGTRTVPTTPINPTSNSRSFNPLRPTPPITQMSRSVSAPTGDMLTLHLLSKIQSPRLHSSTFIRPAEIEGFSEFQLPLGGSTDPRTVMISRGRSRPRSATLLPLSRSSSTGIVATRSASDEGIERGGNGEGLEWTGRRGRSPGPSRMALSRRSTLTSSPNAVGQIMGRGGIGGIGPSRTRSTLSLGAREDRVVGLAVHSAAPSPADVSPALSMEDEEEVVKKDMGLAEVFGRPLGHRQSRSGRRGSGGQIRGSGSRPGRGRRIMTG